MREVPTEEVIERIRLENPWWNTETIDSDVKKMRPRAYLALFLKLVEMDEPRRALILMGPRRVGKTWLIYHAIQSLIDGGRDPKKICYVNIQNPLYNGLSLEKLLFLACEAGEMKPQDNLFVCFDEIQYLRDWEIHLKTLVDSYRNVKFVGSGSAAAALKLKSNESGAGRFTDFLLPPLTFYEYLDLLNQTDLVKINIYDGKEKRADSFSVQEIDSLNEKFIHYLNYGGYPEVIFSEQIQSDPGRFIRGDIIDKVLMKDLPSLYGIQDIQELNSLFQSLTYNTAGEVSLENLSQKSGVAKNTIKRYIEYLESAFLIKVVHRVDRSAKRFQRATRFKVYVTNPSLYCALFKPVGPDDNAIGSLVETAVFAQWFHFTSEQLYYARWKEGEVDIVHLDSNLKPDFAIEVKWSDAQASDPRDLVSLRRFCSEHRNCSSRVTTRTLRNIIKLPELTIELMPASLYCFILGYNFIQSKYILRAFETRPR
ncbi:MAG TPA: ATP-binding protein [Thermoguttaceae bacterium]